VYNRIVSRKAICKFIILFQLIISVGNTSSAQCPVNLDFEMGDFTNWVYESGSFSAAGVNINPLAPPPNPPRHAIITASTVPSRD
jgi:hypothetical protein